MTPDQATEFAARTLAAIDGLDYSRLRKDRDQADRERVASDLAMIRECHGTPGVLSWVASRAADGLRRTGALYGVPE